MEKFMMIYNIVVSLVVVFLFHRTKKLQEQHDYFFRQTHKDINILVEEVAVLKGKIKAPPTITRHMPRPKKNRAVDHIAHGHDHEFVDALKKI